MISPPSITVITLIRQRERSVFITSNHVRSETWTYLRRKADHRSAVGFLDSLESSSMRPALLSWRVCASPRLSPTTATSRLRASSRLGPCGRSPSDSHRSARPPWLVHAATNTDTFGTTLHPLQRRYAPCDVLPGAPQSRALLARRTVVRNVTVLVAACTSAVSPTWLTNISAPFARCRRCDSSTYSQYACLVAP